jgi:hypothetical protein
MSELVAKPIAVAESVDFAIARSWNFAGDLPDESKCFRGSSLHASAPLLLCMGLFSIFWLGAGPWARSLEPAISHGARRVKVNPPDETNVS